MTTTSHYIQINKIVKDQWESCETDWLKEMERNICHEHIQQIHTCRFKREMDLLGHCLYYIYTSFWIGAFSSTYFSFQLKHNLYSTQDFINQSFEAGCPLKYHCESWHTYFPLTMEREVFLATVITDNSISYGHYLFLDWPKKCVIFH